MARVTPRPGEEVRVRDEGDRSPARCRPCPREGATRGGPLLLCARWVTPAHATCVPAARRHRHVATRGRSRRPARRRPGTRVCACASDKVRRRDMVSNAQRRQVGDLQWALVAAAQPSHPPGPTRRSRNPGEFSWDVLASAGAPPADVINALRPALPDLGRSPALLSIFGW